MTNALRIMAESDQARFAPSVALLERGADEGVYPGAVFLVGSGEKPLLLHSVGLRALEGPEASPEKPKMEKITVFDLGGLTGVIGTSVMIMRLVTEGLVKLDDRVVRYIQSFGTLGKSEITVRQLLSHTSGLPSYVAFHEELIKEQGIAKVAAISGKGARDFAQTLILRSSLKFRPGMKQLRSDIGLIVLGMIVEAVSGGTLDNCFRKLLAIPLQLRSTSYIDLDRVKRKDFVPATNFIAPTEHCPTRKRILCGEPSDENCFFMGGISGHSGLFSSAGDLLKITGEIIKGYHGESELLSEDVVKEFWAVPEQVVDSCWAHGWEVPHRKNQMVNNGLSEDARGGYGYTGCALWVEPKSRVSMIFLSNRIHPSRSNKALSSVLPMIFQRALEVIPV